MKLEREALKLEKPVIGAEVAEGEHPGDRADVGADLAGGGGRDKSPDNGPDSGSDGGGDGGGGD